MEKICRVQHLGQIPYQQAWDYQNDLAGEVANGNRMDTLLLLEHPHTYTLGRRGKAENLLWSEEILQQKGIDVLWVDRGGDITYHGPGQIVGYPILKLAPIGWNDQRLPQADYVGYIRKLENVLISSLAEFHISGQRIDGKTGVWVSAENDGVILKIASIGVKVDARGVSRHGFALNVDPDMDYWQGIVPCGLSEVEMTSMVYCLSKDIDKREVSEVIMKCFGAIFHRKLVPEKPSIPLGRGCLIQDRE